MSYYFKERVCVILGYPACKGRIIGFCDHIKSKLLVSELGENMEHCPCSDYADGHIAVRFTDKVKQMRKRLFLFIFIEYAIVDCRRLSSLMIAVNYKIFIYKMPAEALTEIVVKLLCKFGTKRHIASLENISRLLADTH